jgi:hypothetical protein
VCPVAKACALMRVPSISIEKNHQIINAGASSLDLFFESSKHLFEKVINIF